MEHKQHISISYGNILLIIGLKNIKDGIISIILCLIFLDVVLVLNISKYLYLKILPFSLAMKTCFYLVNQNWFQKVKLLKDKDGT